MSLTYGYDLNDGDELMAAPIQATELMSRVVLPGATLVNHLPLRTVIYIAAILVSHSPFSVRHIHSWVPFLSYESLIQRGRELNDKIKNKPIEFVKNAMVCRVLVVLLAIRLADHVIA
jgi:hypothetical protein